MSGAICQRRAQTGAFSPRKASGSGAGGVLKRSVVRRGRVDTFVGVEAGTECQRRLATERRGPRRWSGGKSEVAQDLLRRGAVFDDGDEGHSRVTSRAVEDIEAKGAPKERSPVEPPLATGIVGGIHVARGRNRDGSRSGRNSGLRNSRNSSRKRNIPAATPESAGADDQPCEIGS